MAKNIKETLLSTIVHGKEVLEDIQVTRKLALDRLPLGKSTKEKIDQFHPQELSLVVSAIFDTGKNAKTIRLSTVNGYLPPFQAGQYINIFTVIDGVRTSRPYSISSSPRQRAYYDITVAKAQKGFVSDYFLDHVKIGDTFFANGPAGVFCYQPVFHKKNSVFLAGGSGITPFISMLTEIIDAHMDRKVTLLYGCRSEEMALFHELLKDFSTRFKNFTYHLVLSEANNSWKGETGFIDKSKIMKLAPDYTDSTFYICGPQVMNEFCKKELEELGIPQKQIRREMFGSSQSVVQEQGWPSELTGDEIFKVTIQGEKIIEAKANESLLTAIERNGIRINVCCRSGECSLCRVKLISGNVFLSKGSLLRMADEKFGYIHSCKAYPLSDIEIKY